jgi:hypothetical protein
MKDISGRGRPSKYSSKTLFRAKNYINNCLENDIFPTIEGLSVYLKVGTRTLYDWEVEYPEFSHTLDKLRDIQKDLLITNGLKGGYNTRFAMFLLKANHGMSEKEPLINATQNSYMNISPEVLADAMKIIENEESQKSTF